MIYAAVGKWTLYLCKGQTFLERMNFLNMKSHNLLKVTKSTLNSTSTYHPRREPAIYSYQETRDLA